MSPAREATHMSHIHQSKYKMYCTFTYLYIVRSMDLSGILISLWCTANSLFVRDKYVTPTGKRLDAGYVQKCKRVKTYHLIPQLAVNNTCVWFNDDLLHTYNNYFDNTVYIQQ